MRTALVVVCVLAASARGDVAVKPARGQRWYQGQHGNNRIFHFTATTVGLLLYPALQFVEDDVECRWCGGPNALDRGVRNALVWSDTKTAGQISDLSAYALAPAVNLGLVLAGTLASPSTAGLIDDIVPIAETMVVTEWVTRGIKLGFARERPYAHFTDATGSDDNLSAPSGHTSRAFALMTSAGVIAHTRGYKSEPYIWAAGATIGATAGYLRIAADRHYFSDVVVGAAIGVSAGLTVPLLMRRANATVVPTGTGIAFAGVW